MTKRISFRPRLWPTLITIPVFIILCLLGNWQVERLNWKLDLIEKLESRMAMAPTVLPDADVADARTLDAWEYRKVKVTGHFLHMREMTMYSIGPDGKPGYDLYTPLLTGDDRTVIVNRGWVPENLKQKTSRPVSITDGEVTITGVLRKPWGKAMLGPENELENNNWYFGDLEQMAASQGLQRAFPMFLYADETPNAGGWPLGGRTRVKLANNHLGYVITWYGLALALFGVYMFYHVRFIPVDEHQE